MRFFAPIKNLSIVDDFQAAFKTSLDTQYHRPLDFSSFQGYDISFVIMGLLFVAMAVSEYLYPGIGGSDRIVVKVVNILQMLIALIVVCFTLSLKQITERISFSLFILCFWLCFSGLICSTGKDMSLYRMSIFFYWYVMYLFFFVRSEDHLGKTQTFLIFVFFSLFIWVLAITNFSEIAGTKEKLPKDFLRQTYVGYYLVALFPFALMLKKKSLKVVSFALISYGAIVSLKRGAVLALFLMGFSSSLLHITLLSKYENKIKMLVALILLWSLVAAVVAGFISANKEAVMHRLHSNTGRDLIYEMAYKELTESDFDELIFGHGSRKMELKLGIEPHNDWFLLLYDYGVVGVLAMVTIYIQLLILWYNLFKSKSPLILSLTSSIILMTCVQLYSTGLYLKIFGIITAGIGIVSGKYRASHRIDSLNASRKCYSFMTSDR